MNAKTKEAIMSPQNLMMSALIVLTGGQYALPSDSKDSVQVELNKAKNLEQDKKLEKIEEKLDELPDKIVKEIEKHLKYLESKAK